MPDQTPILSLPVILPAQAQKHVTHNEALRLLDVIVQLTVQSRRTNAPPPQPVEGERHIIGPNPVPGWAGLSGRIALFQDGVWQILLPLAGWLAWVLDEAALATCDGTGWQTLAERPLTVPQLGVATSADPVNRLAVASGGSLLTHAGAGHRLVVNKAAAAETASLVFQSGYSGRAELGLAGSDDFALKVSGDGVQFRAALTVEAASAAVTLAKPVVLTGQAVDPASPAEGSLWVNAAQGQLRARLGGATRLLDAQQDLPWLTPPVGEYVMTSAGCGAATLTLAGAAGRIDLFPFLPRQGFDLDRIALSCTTAATGALAKVAIYASDAEGRPAGLLLETGDIDLATLGFRTVDAALGLRQGQTYWLGVRHNAAPVLSCWQFYATPDVQGGTLPSLTSRKVLRRSLAYASPAPAQWGFASAEITAANATAIWLRRA